MKSARFWAVVLLMTGAALVLRARGNVDRVPASAPLAGLPETIGSWTGRDLPIAPTVLEVLGKGSFLNRIYTPPAPTQPPVMLFIAYFPTQRTGQAIHSPQNCLPGSGWTFVSSGVTDLADPTGKRYQVGEYVISDGKSKQEVLYWYRSHGRSIANDYTAKLYTLTDSIRLNRTDAALIRVVTPVAANQGDAQRLAHLRAVAFAEQVVPLLPPYIPD
jgi:EpsI family protein